jgi:hypothetical protein
MNRGFAIRCSRHGNRLSGQVGRGIPAKGRRPGEQRTAAGHEFPTCQYGKGPRRPLFSAILTQLFYCEKKQRRYNTFG